MFLCCFALVSHFELLGHQNRVFRNVADGRCRECWVKRNPFCRECVCMHASHRLNEAMAFIDGDGNGETKMLCEFVASRSQHVH